jgi:hypothetical protein
MSNLGYIMPNTRPSMQAKAPYIMSSTQGPPTLQSRRRVGLGPLTGLAEDSKQTGDSSTKPLGPGGQEEENLPEEDMRNVQHTHTHMRNAKQHAQRTTCIRTRIRKTTPPTTTIDNHHHQPRTVIGMNGRLNHCNFLGTLSLFLVQSKNNTQSTHPECISARTISHTQTHATHMLHTHTHTHIHIQTQIQHTQHTIRPSPHSPVQRFVGLTSMYPFHFDGLDSVFSK